MYKVALCQMKVGYDKSANIDKARRMCMEAAANGAALVALPEMFSCPYAARYFPEYAEEDGGPTCEALANIARELGVVLVGGSIPEREGSKTYNTSYTYDGSGARLGKHRKAHLFDIDVPGMRFMESETLSAGDGVTVFGTRLGRVGVAICYDMRFTEYLRLYALAGASLIVVPAAFNTVTGPAHWDTTIRARALDNQVYFAAVSCARDMDFTYHAYGYSTVATPWGAIAAQAGEGEEIVYAFVDDDYTQKVRRELPLMEQRRTDIYEVRQVRV